ncbi:hypothetical protein BC2230_50263 [Burkholderia cepacia]
MRDNMLDFMSGKAPSVCLIGMLKKTTHGSMVFRT